MFFFFIKCMFKERKKSVYSHSFVELRPRNDIFSIP